MHKEQHVDYRMKLMTAIAIVLVVAHHIPDAPGFSGPFNMFWPYDYHVSVFVFVSGYFYREASESRPFAFIGHKAYRLLLPLYAVSLIYGLLVVWLHVQGFVFGGEFDFINVLVAPFVSGHQWAINSPMWFLAALFGTHVINFAIRMLLRSVPSGTVKEFGILALYLMLGSIAVAQGGPEGIEPQADTCQLPLLRSLFFLVPFAFGRIYRVFLEKHDTVSSTVYFLILFAIEIVISVVSQDNARYLVAWCKFPSINDCGLPLAVLVTYVAAATGIAFLLRICRILGPRLGPTKTVRAIADGSMSIMNHHGLAFFLVSTSYFLVGQNTGLFESFNVAAWLADPFYVFVPRELVQTKIVYLVAGIALPLAIHAIWLQIKTFITSTHHQSPTIRT